MGHVADLNKMGWNMAAQYWQKVTDPPTHPLYTFRNAVTACSGGSRSLFQFIPAVAQLGHHNFWVGLCWCGI